MNKVSLSPDSTQRVVSFGWSNLTSIVTLRCFILQMGKLRLRKDKCVLLRVIQLAHGRVAAVFHKILWERKGPHFSGCSLSLQYFLTCPFQWLAPESCPGPPGPPGQALSAEAEEASRDLLPSEVTGTLAPPVDNHVYVLTLVFLTPGPDPQ